MKPFIDDAQEETSGNTSAALFYLLIVTDLCLIFIHILYRFGGLDISRNFSITLDGGYPEIYQYVKEFWLLLLFLLLAFRKRALVYFSWALLFVFILLDDALSIHETIGGRIAESINFYSPLGLRPQDVGEIAVFAAAGLIFLLAFAISLPRSSPAGRRMSSFLFALFFLLVFFSVFLDSAVYLLDDRLWRRILGSVEDGAELLIMTWMLTFTFTFVTAGLEKALEQQPQLKSLQSSLSRIIAKVVSIFV